MNRRGFLRGLVAAPIVAAAVPLIPKAAPQTLISLEKVKMAVALRTASQPLISLSELQRQLNFNTAELTRQLNHEMWFGK